MKGIYKVPESAFETYYGLGQSRTFKAVAEIYGAGEHTVRNAARRDRWVKRVEKRDEAIRRATEARVIETVAEQNDRHLRMLRIVQKKALDALRNLPLTNTMDAIRAIDMTIKQERLIIGEPTDRKALEHTGVVKTIAELIVAEADQFIDEITASDDEREYR